MIREDLHYAIKAGRPLLIDPIKVKSFLANAEIILSNPDLAYFLSQRVAKDGYKPKRAVKKADLPFYVDSPTDDSTDDTTNPLSKDCTPYVQDGTGIIPICGVIGKGLSPLESMLGCADIDIISKALDDWKDRDDVYEVVARIDSGGGATTGLEELAKKYREYPKPTISFTDSDCGSAAFWFGSQAKRFVCTPSASIGACGVYITMNDDSKKFEQQGRKVVVIKSGKYKAAGVEGTSLTDDQQAQLQEEVNELHRRFIRDVLSVRSFVSMDDLQGQSFYGDIAAARGLATGVVDSFEALLTDIKNTRRLAHTNTLHSLYQPPTSANIQYNPQG